MDDDTKENDERSNMEEEEEKKMIKMEYKIRNDKKFPSNDQKVTEYLNKGAYVKLENLQRIKKQRIFMLR